MINPVQYKLNSWFAISTGLNYTQKAYETRRSDFFSGIYEDATNNYVQLPVMGHLIFGHQKIQGFINASGYCGYWASGRLKGSKPGIFSPIANPTSTAYEYIAQNSPSMYNW